MTSTQSRQLHSFGLIIVMLLFALVGTFGALFQLNCPNLINHFVCNGIDQTKAEGEAVCNKFLIGEISIYLGLPWIFTGILIIISLFFAYGTREGNTYVGSYPMLIIYLSFMFFFIFVGISWSRYYRQLLPCIVDTDPNVGTSCIKSSKGLPEKLKQEIEYFNTIITPGIGASCGGAAAICLLFVLLTYKGIKDKKCTLIFKTDCKDVY